MWVKRLGLFVDPSAFAIKLPDHAKSDFQSYGAKIISLDEIRRVSKKLQSVRLKETEKQTTRHEVLHYINDYVEEEMGHPLEGGMTIAKLSSKNIGHQYKKSVIFLRFDLDTQEVLKEERFKFFREFKAGSLLEGRGTPEPTFASFGFIDNYQFHEAYEQLTGSGVINQAITLSRAIPEKPLLEL